MTITIETPLIGWTPVVKRITGRSVSEIRKTYFPDAGGDAVIISVGRDGRVAYTRKTPGGVFRQAFLIGGYADPLRGRLLVMGDEGVLRNDHPLDLS